MPLIAHFSDVHLVAPLWRGGWLLNPKQALALLNWWWRRRWRQRMRALTEAVETIVRRRPDLVLVTGDHAQMGRAADYAHFYSLLRPLRQARIPTLLLEGNHDHYSTFPRAREFLARIRRELSAPLDWNGGPLRLDGLDILPVGGACPTPAFQCWGRLDESALAELAAAFAALPPRPGTARLACGHFPLRSPAGTELPEKTGLRGAERVLALLRSAGAQAYLCGHIHRPFTVTLPGDIPQYCAGSLTIGGTLGFYRCGAAGVTPEN